MKGLKTSSLFKISILLCANLIAKNIIIEIISFFIMLFSCKKELFIFVLLILIINANNIYSHDYINYGYIEEINSNYVIVNKILYKTKITTKTEVNLGDIVSYNNNSMKIEDDFYQSQNIIFMNSCSLIKHGKLALFSWSNNRLIEFKDNSKQLFTKVLFNSSIYNNIEYNVGFGYGLYYFIRSIYKKNKNFSIIILITLSLLFGFNIKLILILIDYFLSFTSFDKCTKFSLSLLTIIFINYHLLFNYSFLISLCYRLFSFIESEGKLFIYIIQSYFFNSIQIFMNYLYKTYQVLKTIIYLICLVTFFFSFLESKMFVIMNILSIAIDFFTISIRGKISSISIIIIILFRIFIKNFKRKELILLLSLLTNINMPFKYVCFIDVGQGDSILIRDYFGQKNIMIDTGSTYNYSKLKNELYKYGIYKIDFLIITHNDLDHCGNIDNIKEDFLVENTIYTPINIETNDIKLININNNIYYNDNDNSLIYYTESFDLSFLFTGDISKNVEKDLINNNKLKHFDVIKISHHGSKSATSSQFIGNILPRFAVISTNGNYGHPSLETIRTLDSFLVDTYITKDSGSVSFVFSPIIDFVKTDSNHFDIIVT